MDPATATIEVVRDTPDDIQDRWIRVFIDEAPKEILRYGETLRRQVPPGSHRIKAHNTLSSDTIQVDIGAGQTARIRCYNYLAKSGPIMLLTMGVAAIKVRLELI